MKNNILLKNSITLLLPLALAVGVLFGVSRPSPKEVEGYTTSSLPTTIDLNDTSAANIRSYYSSLNNLSTSERQGNNLLKNLKTILKNGQKYYAYDGTTEGRKIWQMYEIVDRDWSKSPASAINSYNSSTNTISNYSYGISYSSPGTNPYIHALYVDRDVTNEMRAWQYNGSTENNHGGNKEWYIDREHIWPKSQGFEESGEGGARGDPMHLWPGDSDVNSSIHNNNFYGYVDISNATSQGKWSYATKNYLGPSLTLNNGTNVFEPQDCDKGDIARAIFYMVARYNYLSNSDSDGISTNNPNLCLVQDNTVLSSYTSSTSTTGKMGILTDLLAWHHADPVDEYEIHRNNLLYTNYTNNRNPFIDFPEWVDFIWGTANYSGTSYQSYSSTPTGYATPSTDTINGYNSGSVTSSTLTTSGSVEAAGGALEGWTSVGTGSAYADGSVKLDNTGDNVYCLSLFSGAVSYKMTELSVTINGKVYGSPTAANSYKVEAVDSDGNVLGSDTKTGSDIFLSDSLTDVVFNISGNLTNCTGIRITYSNKGGGNFAIKSVSWTAAYLDASAPVITSISAYANKTFYVGDTVNISDITVKDNNNTAISGFSFANNGYRIKYSDAPSGGVLSTKTFNNAITYESFTCSLTINVQRAAHGASSSTLTYAGTDFEGAGISSSYTANQTATINGITFKVSGYIYSHKLSLSQSKTSAPGSVINTTPYSRGITNVTVGGAIPNIQLSVNGSTWVNLNSASPSTTDYYFFKVYYSNTTQTNYVNINSIVVTTKNETPVNVANYIMYEDTNNQCTSKFTTAIDYFEGMLSSGRATFMTSDDYVISTACERLQAWARHLGKQITYSDNDYIVSDAQNSALLFNNIATTERNTFVVIALIALTSVSAVGGFIFIKRRKQENK